MAVEKIRGIVIGEKQTGESSKQISVLAKELGRVTLSAKGAKNTKSKLLAATQLFAYCDFSVFSGKGFYSVTQGDLIESFYGLREDMEKLAEAAYLAELVEKSCPMGMEQDEALKLLLTTLSVLEKGDMPPALVSRIFEVKYLQISGFLAEEGCVACGGEGDYFDPAEGVFLCASHQKKSGMPLLPAVKRALAFIAEQEGRGIFAFRLSEEALAQMDTILGECLLVHMGLQLKSRNFGREL